MKPNTSYALVKIDFALDVGMLIPNYGLKTYSTNLRQLRIIILSSLCLLNYEK
jgi:hypothetical protein